MTKTIYIKLSELSNLQEDIMKYIDIWVHTEKTPIPLREVIANMKHKGIKEQTTIKAIRVLLVKGYIRRSNEISNKTTFVQLRRV